MSSVRVWTAQGGLDGCRRTGAEARELLVRRLGVSAQQQQVVIAECRAQGARLVRAQVAAWIPASHQGAEGGVEGLDVEHGGRVLDRGR